MADSKPEPTSLTAPTRTVVFTISISKNHEPTDYISLTSWLTAETG